MSRHFLNKHLISIFILSAILCCKNVLASQRIIKQQLPMWLEQANTPAAAVALVENGKVQWSVVAGTQQPGVEADSNTLFNVASLAKPVSAELAIQLVKKHGLNLESPAAQYWIDPDIKEHNWLGKLTFSHLLSHQSGFPNWRAQTENVLTFNFEPGTRSGYSGEGYVYLARALENKTHQSFEDMLHQAVLAPAGVTSAMWSPGSEYASRMAHPKGPEGKFGKPSTTRSAADDLYITIDDYAKFTQFVINEHVANPATPEHRWQITHDMRDQLCQPERLVAKYCPNHVGFAMGWSVFEYDKRSLYLQGGGDWGERSMVVISPEEQKAVIVFTNGAGGMKVIRRVMHTLLAHPQLDAFIQMQGG
jgi:CubicO group peptidase (beta-lactamase class C family)